MVLILAIVAVEGGTGKGICLRNEGVGFLNRPGGAGGERIIVYARYLSKL